jgi:hypothetical protein
MRPGHHRQQLSRSIEPSEIHLLGMLPAEDQVRVFPLREPITLGPVMNSAYPLYSSPSPR